MKGIIKTLNRVLGYANRAKELPDQPAGFVPSKRPVSGVVRAVRAAGARPDQGTLRKYKQIQQERNDALRSLDWKIAQMTTPLDDWEPAAIAYHCSRGKRQVAPAEDVPMDDWPEEMIAQAAAKARTLRNR